MTNHQSPITNHVLFICTGNICRSPIAQALLEHRYRNESRITSHESRASSAGLSGLDGQPAHPLAREVMSERNIDLSHHRARTVTPDLLNASTLILTMETAHQEWILSRMPTLQGRVYLLGHWRDLEIRDPLAGGHPEFQRVAEEIDQCLTDWCRSGFMPDSPPVRHKA